VKAPLPGEKARRCYDILAWIAMPNHVPVVGKPIRWFAQIMRWWHTTTAKRAHVPLGRTGEAFRQREYFDGGYAPKNNSAEDRIGRRTSGKKRPGSVSRRMAMVTHAQDTGGKTAGATSATSLKT
jgi:hypothetical protein